MKHKEIINEDNKENSNAQVNDSTNSKKKKKTKFSKVLTIVVCIIIAISVLSVVVAMVVKSTNTVSDPHFDVEVSTDTGEETVKDDSTWLSENGNFNVLVLGFDKAAVLTDVMMLVNVNLNDSSITIMQIPRDTYFNNVNNDSYYKMNGVYRSYISDSSNNSLSVDAARGMAGVLETSLCVNIEYVAVMDLDGFKEIVDAVGGVEMDVPEDMDYEDPNQNLYIHLKAGYQTLDGDMAEQFVRFRSGYANADLSRENAQKLFMTAFIKKLKNSVSISNLNVVTKLADAVTTYCATDLSIKNIVDLAPDVLDIDMSNITLLTIPSNSASGYMVVNRALTLETVNEYFNVFENDVTDGMFDKSLLFTAKESVDSKIYEAYYSDNAIDGYSFSAGEIDNNTVTVPMN